MDKFTFFEKHRMPDYRKLRDISWGKIEIDHDICVGCGLCMQACPADSLTIKDRKAFMKPADGSILADDGISQCIACCDCAALCPEGAITLKTSYRWTKFFKSINRGELSLPRL